MKTGLRERAAGGGLGWLGCKCCQEQEGVSGAGVKAFGGGGGSWPGIEGSPSECNIRLGSEWCDQFRDAASAGMQLLAERESAGPGLLGREGGRENWSTSFKPSWSWMWAEWWRREDARRGGGELRCRAQPAPRRPLLAGLQPRSEGVSE